MLQVACRRKQQSATKARSLMQKGNVHRESPEVECARERDQAARIVAVQHTRAEQEAWRPTESAHPRGAHSDNRRGRRMGECWCFINNCNQDGRGNNRVPGKRPRTAAGPFLCLCRISWWILAGLSGLAV